MADTDVDVFAKSTARPLSTPRRELTLSKVTLKRGLPKSRETERVGDKAMHTRLKLPVLTRPRIVRIKEDNSPQAPLREAGCFDLSPEGITPNGTTGRKKQLFGMSDSQNVTIWINGQEITRERSPFIDFENYGRDMNEDKRIRKEIDHGNVLPLPASVLKGKQVTISQKGSNANKENTRGYSKQRNCKQTDKAQKLSYQTGSTSKDADMKNNSSKTLPRQTNCTAVQLQPRKLIARPVLHLPKADKYDITRPGNIITGKVGSVHIEGHKSGDKNRKFIPATETCIIKNSVFKTLLQRRTVFLRQPSPLAGVNFKVHLKQQQNYFLLRDTIQAVEKTNIRPPSVEIERPRPVKTLVVKLPPIC